MVEKHGRSCLEATIIGNTSWGNNLGALLSGKGIAVKLWARSEADEAVLVIWAVLSQSLRHNVSQATDYLTNSMLLMSAAKGLEVNSGKRMSQVLAEEIAPSLRDQICVLSGPNLAKETGQALPAASVIAARDISLAGRARKLMESPRFFLATCSSTLSRNHYVGY